MILNHVDGLCRGRCNNVLKGKHNIDRFYWMEARTMMIYWINCKLNNLFIYSFMVRGKNREGDRIFTCNNKSFDSNRVYCAEGGCDDAVGASLSSDFLRRFYIHSTLYYFTIYWILNTNWLQYFKQHTHCDEWTTGGGEGRKWYRVTTNCQRMHFPVVIVGDREGNTWFL